jgi:hypothetical protein
MNNTGLNETLKYVQQFSSPRLFYGVGQSIDDRGLCYYNGPLYGIDESIRPTASFQNIANTTNTTNTTNTMVVPEPQSSVIMPFYKFSSSEVDILKNPIFDNQITYEDTISWGCVDKLNVTGLKYFCTNQLWKQKMIFNIVQNLTHISQFGNANRHFSLDWIAIEPFSFDTYQSIWDETYHKCTIPAVFNIDILYATYGAVNNTQVGVYKVQFRMEYVYWWSKNIFNSNVKDNFFTNVNVNYFRIPQDKVWWYASAPGFIMLPRNIMYPFRVGTTTYGVKTSAAFLSLSSGHFYLILFLIIIFN